MAIHHVCVGADLREAKLPQMTRFWNQIKAWWTRADRLEAEVVKLRQEREDCIDVLKVIATTPLRPGYRPIDVADRQLKKMGMIPIVVRPACPPDKIYFLNPADWGIPSALPTDYLSWRS